jgi:hypothetical protein
MRLCVHSRVPAAQAVGKPALKKRDLLQSHAGKRILIDKNTRRWL